MSSKRVLVREASFDEVYGSWPILVCEGCNEQFVWKVQDAPGNDRPRYHSDGCKKSHTRGGVRTPRFVGFCVTGSTCPDCGKVASPTLEAAKMEKKRIERASGHSNAVRYYECQPSGYVHWTRMDADKKSRVAWDA